MNRQLCLLVLITILASFAMSFPGRLDAASTNEARVTRVKNHVQLADSKAIARRALVNDIVHEQTIVRTGNGSRAEVTFSDETVVRLTAHTEFDFVRGTRGLNLGDGAVLVQAPKEANGATIHAGSVAAAVAGTTVMIEYHPGFYKFLVLEGTARTYRPGHLGDSVLVGPGQMVFGNPESALSDPVDVDIDRFMKTSRFITDFPQLRSVKSIAAQSQKQQREKSTKTLVDTNLVIFGGGTQVSVTDQGQTDTADQKTAALVTPHRVPNLSPNAAPALP
ncbi:MAG TPA: FecR domain-containing protein [Candidatus Udaeobacter sp.]|nr:FecR domain-containing protein [Candidatus Udaeobacter sp.]